MAHSWIFLPREDSDHFDDHTHCWNYTKPIFREGNSRFCSATCEESHGLHEEESKKKIRPQERRRIIMVYVPLSAVLLCLIISMFLPI